MIKFRVKPVRDGFGKTYYKVQRRESWWRPWRFVDERGDPRHPLVYYTYGREYETVFETEAEVAIERFRMRALSNVRIG
ncbi:hypothetical protein VPHD148_0040 [Vibrio phage D148]